MSSDPYINPINKDLGPKLATPRGSTALIGLLWETLLNNILWNYETQSLYI